MVRSFEDFKIPLLFSLANAYFQVCSSYHSSERLNITRHTRQAPAERRHKDECILPPKPTNGNYIITLDPRHPISEYSIIKFKCDEGYALYPVDSRRPFLCYQGRWEKIIPRCIQVCPPTASEFVSTKCVLGENEVDCSQPMLEGTSLWIKCKNLYEPVQPSRLRGIYCVNGSWSSELVKCIPECGKLTLKGDFPWHVGVYRNINNIPSQICGGSLINTKVILSAAHCFTKEYLDEMYTEKDFLIAAGKYYRNFNDSRDTYAQYSSVKQLIVHQDYKALLSSYAADIAIVILETPFKITHVVQPVCVDWTNELEDSQLITGQQGAVVGWGYTKEGSDPSDNLKILRVPFIDRGQCFEVVPEDFYTYLTLDKFCTGFVNGSSVCQGDDGGGLVFYSADTKRYYIRGLVSVGPINGDSCDSRQYSAYTKVSKYLDFINRAEVINRPD